MAWNDFVKNFRDALSQAKEKVHEEASGGDKTGSRAPQEVWGFEQDKSRYGDVSSTSPEVADKLTWRDYTVTPKGNERVSKNFSIGYDENGRIAGVRSKEDNGEILGYYGKDLLKSFFSQFDRDATSYRVWQNESYDNGDGTGQGQAKIIFDSDKKNKPFIPSQIFKNRGLSPLPITPPLPPSSLPEIDATFFNNYRNNK